MKNGSSQMEDKGFIIKEVAVCIFFGSAAAIVIKLNVMLPSILYKVFKITVEIDRIQYKLAN